MTDSSIDRRRFLTAAALTAGASALPGGPLSGRALAAVPPQITLPERGIHDTSPASTWTDGFLTGNGEFGAVLHGAPALEKVVFNHHRLVLPNGTRDVNPPVISGRLEAHATRLSRVTTRGPTGTSPRAGRCAGRRPTTPRTNCTSTHPA
ncbi:glycoside hydrolase N-terminal domain-containing protein [Streptomyces sp. NPDC004232]|uniref:glycoside hydrolase N-terminal domain-containing protein n=1 Tax=unclassified Streptomyces TaxID=2593676 RepID=UPI0033B54637